jgi:hypothetical protein
MLSEGVWAEVDVERISTRSLAVKRSRSAGIEDFADAWRLCCSESFPVDLVLVGCLADVGDEEAKALAESFGAARLLDKMGPFDELIPTILAVG